MGFARSWVEASPVHAPLVPTLSALSMMVFGATRSAAELVLPLSTLLWAWASFRVVERFYGRPTAAATVALAATFPVAQVLARTYLFEHPMAALFAAAIWALVASDLFARTGPTLLFGALAGLVAVARTAGPVYLVGPTLVAVALALRRPGAVDRLLRLAAATAIGLLVAATWYLPNLSNLLAYIHRVTYGAAAQMYTGGESAVSWQNFLYYVQWVVVDGPGFPMVAVGLVAWIVALRTGTRPRLRSFLTAALIAFALSFGPLLGAAQRVGAILFLPLLPIVALALVRAVASVPAGRWRSILAVGLALLAAHHVVAMTLATYPNSAGSRGPYPQTFPLWNHRNPFVDLAASVGAKPGIDLRIPEIVDRLDALGLPADARIAVLSDHPFLHVHNVRHEAWDRGRTWRFHPGPSLQLQKSPTWTQEFRNSFTASDAVVLRSGGASYLSRGDYGPVFDALRREGVRRFQQVGEALPIADGSSIRIFRREADVQRVAQISEGFLPAEAQFLVPGARAIRLEAAQLLEEGPEVRLLRLVFAVDPQLAELPAMSVHLVDAGAMIFSFDSKARDLRKDVPGPDDGTHWIVDRLMASPLPPKLPSRGYSVALVLEAPPDAATGRPRRRFVQSRLRTDEESTRLHVWAVPPVSVDDPAASAPAPAGSGAPRLLPGGPPRGD